MNVIEVTEKIKAMPLFKDLALLKPTDDSQFGTIAVSARHFKDKNKNEYKLTRQYSLFVAHIYKDSDNMEEFFYLTFYNKGVRRDYKRRTWSECEYNKIFASGKTVEEIIEDFKNKTKNFELK